MLKVADLELNVISRTVVRNGRKIDLAPRELRLLEALMRNAGRLMTRKMLLEQVWGYQFDPKTSIVQTFVSRLRRRSTVISRCRWFTPSGAEDIRSMRLRSSILRGTAFRFSIYFAVLFALIALIAGWGFFAWVSGEFHQRQASFIADMKDTLLTVARNEGFAGLREVVLRKARVSPDAGIIYLLTDKSGGFIAGNIDPIPTFAGNRFIPWRDLSLRTAWSDATIPSGMTASWTTLDDGNLLIGDDDGDIIEAQNVLFSAIAIGT